MKVEYYITPDSKKPLTKWLDRLRDRQAKAAIFARIARVQIGLLGDAKSIGEGVYELRIDVGAGYRVYYARSGKEIVLLLCGGDKKTQTADTIKAKEYWNDYKKRTKETE
ncbi:MAG: type II toxin-antitoxin system RelE/ParE family toxin [Pyrinomonadaceae bacterium]